MLLLGFPSSQQEPTTDGRRMTMRMQCTAVANGNRISLVIRQGEKGYKAFAKVLDKIDKAGCMSWYGDVTTVDGKEQCGLVITCKPNAALKSADEGGVEYDDRERP